MIKQSYQEVSKEIIDEIKKGKLAKTSLQYQSYFYNLQKKQPARFERLMFDINGQEPFSEDLEDILRDLNFWERCMFARRGVPKKDINKYFRN